MLFLITTAIGTLSAILPAIYATSTTISKAIRYE